MKADKPREQEICVTFFGPASGCGAAAVASGFAAADFFATGFAGLRFVSPTTEILPCERHAPRLLPDWTRKKFVPCPLRLSIGEAAPRGGCFVTTDCNTAMSGNSTSIVSISVHLVRGNAA
ncbi:hypothetical protein [Parvibaculum sp.]|uniref:hypothetical protein n=1 Tax=Parvibaculum sp. TaxID=2024848 RepID=UPI0025F55B88|nr:hypothetical protein [Parvibaculum sp.]